MSRATGLAVQLCGVALLASMTATARAADLDRLLEEYRELGAGQFSAEAGEALWRTELEGGSCSSCHTEAPRNAGRHYRTGKPIEPMAPSVNPKRLTDLRHMKKWLLRNCKSTLGRECTVQEKGDVLTWLREQ